MKPRPIKYTVAVDFDGVLHDYNGDFKASHIIEGEPINGAIEWLYFTLQKMDVVIFSCRAHTWRGRRAIRKWLKKHGGNLFYEHMDGRGL